MQTDDSDSQNICAKCLGPFGSGSPTLFCRHCGLKLHKQCLLEVFPHLDNHLTPDPASNDWQWECFSCSCDKSASLEPKCMFCSQSSGFLVKIELQPVQFNETAKTHWGHLKCIDQRKTCEKHGSADSFYYSNTLNYIKRISINKKGDHCKKCKGALNLECRCCEKFFGHCPCPAVKGEAKKEMEFCPKCLKSKKSLSISSSKKSNTEPNRSHPESKPIKTQPEIPLQGSMKPGIEGLKASDIELEDTFLSKDQAKTEATILQKDKAKDEESTLQKEDNAENEETPPQKEKAKKTQTEKTHDCKPKTSKLKGENTKKLPKPTPNHSQTSSITSNSDSNPLIPEEVKESLKQEDGAEPVKRSKSSYVSTPIYKTRAPDILIKLLNDLMTFDRFALLRSSSLELDFEKSENFLKNIEKYQENHIFKAETILNYNDVSQQYLVFDSENCNFEFLGPKKVVKSSRKYTNVDLVHQKATKNMYFTFKDFEKDLFKVFSTVYLTKCLSQASRNYFFSIVVQYLKMLKTKKYATSFIATKYNDIESIVTQETFYKLPCDHWPVIPISFRHYELIDCYMPIEMSCDVSIDLKAYKTTVKCPENCGCWSFETLGEFSYELSTWVSSCPNRAQKIECDSRAHDGICKNMAIGQKQRKLPILDVEETLSWGIDIYTRKNIFMVLPENKDEIEMKFEFIQNKLMKAINLQDWHYKKEHGYDMRNACDYIIQNSKKDSIDPMFDLRDREYAKILLKALNMCPDPEAFRIHSKGQGLICKNRDGFKKNEFIVEYFGELYPPYYWYEKQDQVKKYLKDKQRKNVLLDFYNIMLEIHRNDPKGYNIFFVDPIHKGNYSSRLSHSCDPNCGTVTTIVNGQYVIGMYAMKDINFGEELTFDYCSVTEDPNELKKAFCLCGSKKCRGKYLELIKTKESNTFIEQVHGFLERNKIIFRASIEKFNEKDQEILDNCHLKDRILENTPEWLKKWLALTLEFVEREKSHTRDSLDEKMKGTTMTPEEEKRQKEINEYWANSHKESRIQNLVITCDKVKYFLRKSKSTDPPFSVNSEMEMYELLWGKPEKGVVDIDARDTTVINDVLKSLWFHRDLSEAMKCIHFIHLIDEDVQQMIKKDSKRVLSLIRFAFLMLSLLLKDLNYTEALTSNAGMHRSAMSDICYFYAFTHTYFKTGEYNQTPGDTVYVRNCDVSNVETYIEGGEAKN